VEGHGHKLSLLFTSNPQHTEV